MKYHLKVFLIYNAACKTQCNAMFLWFIFDNKDGYIRKHDVTKYLAFFQN